jgi:hypothetical protein
MARMHGAGWFTLRHDFIDWFGSVIEPRTEHDCDKPLSTVHRFRRLSVQILQPTTHAQRYAAMRQINGMSIVKPTAIFETKSPWVSMVLLGRVSVQILQARMREGKTFRHIHSSADDLDVCARL